MCKCRCFILFNPKDWYVIAARRMKSVKLYASHRLYKIRIDYIPKKFRIACSCNATDYIPSYDGLFEISALILNWFLIIINLRGEIMKNNPLMKQSEQLAVEIDLLCRTLDKKENSNTIFQIKKVHRVYMPIFQKLNILKVYPTCFQNSKSHARSVSKQKVG